MATHPALATHDRRGTRRSRIARFLAVLALLFGAVARSTALGDDPCADDLKQLCPDVKPGSARAVSCLRGNEPKLSGACREKLQADALRAKSFIEEFGRACRADVSQFCAGVDPGAGRVIGCLNQHQLELSPSCQAYTSKLSEARERVSVLRTACKADAERVCKGVPAKAGPLLECLQANEANLSAECNREDIRRAVDAASVVDVVEDMSSQEHVRQSLQILQGLDSVAFSRSQILLQFDSYQALQDSANGGRMLFNPQFVFGPQNEFAFQVKMPVTTIYPYAAGEPTQFGLGAVSTALAWNFAGKGRVRQYLALGLQIETASTPAVGGPWAVVPSYAIGAALQRWLSITTQVQWTRSIGSSSRYPELNLFTLEPILAATLPGRSYLALDTRLGWDFVRSTFIPIMKGVAGLYTDRQKSLSISVWYQATLSQSAQDQFFQYGVGLGLAYFFDW
jgi:hypothetical protein